jgi:hypothetical protein
MINCQATFCTPLKSVKIGRALLETSNCGRNFNIVEKGKKIAYGECRKNFNDILFSCKPDVFHGRVSPYSLFY